MSVLRFIHRATFCFYPPLGLSPVARNSRNFLLQHPVIPRRWRNSLASEHVRQHLVLDGDTPAVHMQARRGKTLSLCSSGRATAKEGAVALCNCRVFFCFLCVGVSSRGGGKVLPVQQ